MADGVRHRPQHLAGPQHARPHYYCAAGQARRRIANTHLNYARYCLIAPEGMLTESEPVLMTATLSSRRVIARPHD